MKIIKLFLYFFILLISLFALILISVEILNLGTKFTKKNPIKHLHNIGYYEKNMNNNPYKEFNVKYLHPYLAWSTPWKSEDIAKINNEVVSLNEKGLRNNPFIDDKKNNAVLLGGSTAFGYYSSSDKTTPAALLSKNSSLNFYNLNGPSWNSHQELISLIKFKKDYDISLSLTGVTDLSIFCQYTLDTELEDNYIDAVENFILLNNVYNKIIDQVYNVQFDTLIKFFILKIFPENIKLINYYKNKQKKKNSKIVTNDNFFSKCFDEEGNVEKKLIDKLVNQFISNHELMKLISESRGASHFVILQPEYSLNINKKNSSIMKHQEYFYQKIKENKFCEKNCYDLSKVFIENNIEASNFAFNTDGNYNDEIFIDSSHLSDKGSEFLVNEILKKINLIN